MITISKIRFSSEAEVNKIVSRLPRTQTAKRQKYSLAGRKTQKQNIGSLNKKSYGWQNTAFPIALTNTLNPNIYKV